MFVAYMIIAIVCGGFIGVVYDRHKRARYEAPKPVGARRLRAMNPVRPDEVFWHDREGDDR